MYWEILFLSNMVPFLISSHIYLYIYTYSSSFACFSYLPPHSPAWALWCWVLGWAGNSFLRSDKKLRSMCQINHAAWQRNQLTFVTHHSQDLYTMKLRVQLPVKRPQPTSTSGCGPNYRSPQITLDLHFNLPTKLVFLSVASAMACAFSSSF